MKKLFAMVLVLSLMATMLAGISVQAADASVPVYTETFADETASTTSVGTGTIMENEHFRLRSWSPTNYIYDGASYGYDGNCFSITPDGSTGNTGGANIMLDFKDTVPANAKTITFQMYMRANTTAGGYFSLMPNGDSFGLGATVFADGGTAQVYGPDGNGQIGATWADGGGWTRLTYTYNMIAHTLSFEAYTPDTGARNTQTFTAKDDAQWEAIGLGDIDENGHTIRIQLDSGVNQFLLDNISLSYTLPGESTITATTDGHGVLQKDGDTVSSFQVADGTTVTMTAVADSGYELAEVLVNGAAVTTNNGEFSFVANSDITVYAKYKKAGTVWSYDFTDAPEGAIASNVVLPYGTVLNTAIGKVQLRNWLSTATIVDVNGDKKVSNSASTASNDLSAFGTAGFRFFELIDGKLPTGAVEMIYSWTLRMNDDGSGSVRFEFGDDSGKEDLVSFDGASNAITYYPDTNWSNPQVVGTWDEDHIHKITLTINNETGERTFTVYDTVDASTDSYTTDSLGTMATFILMNNSDSTSRWKVFLDDIQVSYKTDAPKVKVTNTVGANGKLQYEGADAPATIENIEVGSSVTLKAVADFNYEIDTITVDGTPVTPNSNGEFTVSNIQANTEVSVTFKETTRADVLFNLSVSDITQAAYRFEGTGDAYNSAVIYTTITRPSAWTWDSMNYGLYFESTDGVVADLAAQAKALSNGDTTARFGIRVYGPFLNAGTYYIRPYAKSGSDEQTGDRKAFAVLQQDGVVNE